MDIIKDLYASEINFKIETFWDKGFNVVIGDALNGYIDSNSFDTFEECVSWLSDRAIKFYPGSEFAKKYNNKQS